MPSERTSPSGGWREVASELCADGGVDHEDATTDADAAPLGPCPDCGRTPGVEGDDLCCEIHRARRRRNDGA